MSGGSPSRRWAAAALLAGSFAVAAATRARRLATDEHLNGWTDEVLALRRRMIENEREDRAPPIPLQPEGQP